VLDKTTRVHYGEVFTVPITTAVLPIPGNPRSVIHNRLAFPNQAVKKSRFAYVGTPYYRDDVAAHNNNGFRKGGKDKENTSFFCLNFTQF
jgi:hypothetical protein